MVSVSLVRVLGVAAALTLCTRLDAQATGFAVIDSATVARNAYRAATVALRSGDTLTALRELDHAYTAWPTQEVYAWARVAIAAAKRDTIRVLNALDAYATGGFGRDVRADTRLAPFIATPRGQDIARRMEANFAPMPRSRTWATFGDSTHWIEGMDIDARTGHAFVADLHHRRIIEIARDGATIRTLPAPAADIGAILAVRVDVRRGVLWATTSGIPQMVNYVPGDSAIAALLRIRLSDGVVERRWDIAPATGGHVLGDVALAANGDVLFSDSSQPFLYRLRANGDSLERFTHPLFRSLQGVAPTNDGRAAYVADYSHGILRVDLTSKDVIRLADAGTSSSLGCDGIVLHDGSIIAVQNGVLPPRITRFTLDASGTRIARAEVIDRNSAVADEPTIGTIVGNEFVYVANSQWEKRDDRGAMLPGARRTRPVLLTVRLN